MTLWSLSSSHVIMLRRQLWVFHLLLWRESVLFMWVLKFFFFVFRLKQFYIMCLNLDYFLYILLKIHRSFWTWGLMSFINLGTFLVIMSLQTASLLILFFFSCWDLNHMHVSPSCHSLCLWYFPMLFHTLVSMVYFGQFHIYFFSSLSLFLSVFNLLIKLINEYLTMVIFFKYLFFFF